MFLNRFRRSWPHWVYLSKTDHKNLRNHNLTSGVLFVEFLDIVKTIEGLGRHAPNDTFLFALWNFYVHCTWVSQMRPNPRALEGTSFDSISLEPLALLSDKFLFDRQAYPEIRFLVMLSCDCKTFLGDAIFLKFLMYLLEEDPEFFKHLLSTISIPIDPELLLEAADGDIPTDASFQAFMMHVNVAMRALVHLHAFVKTERKQPFPRPEEEDS